MLDLWASLIHGDQSLSSDASLFPVKIIGWVHSLYINEPYPMTDVQ
jgi:hypothetical protein